MLIYYVLLAALVLFRIKFSSKGTLSNSLDKDNTTCIKGVFAIIILLSHTYSCLTESNILDSLYSGINSYIGQLMVVMFFVYSGYGISEGQLHKPNYVRGFAKNRIFKTWLHFALAVLAFVILSLSLGREYSFKRYILAFTGWTTLGNENWFMTMIILLFIASWLAMLVSKNNRLITNLITTAATLLLMVCIGAEKPVYWVNTIITFPLGMWISFFKDKLAVWFDNIAVYIVSLLASLMLLITMKFSVNNGILRWLGENAFSIYILQRLPMIVLQYFELDGNNLLFSVAAIAATMLLAWGFSKLTKLIDVGLFGNGRRNISVKSEAPPTA